jgi:uncharacterized membrane protein YhaH (DUF805 family)
MTILARYFLSHGRVARGAWLFRMIASSVTALAFGLLAQAVAGAYGAAVVAALYVWSSGALAAQRLHDTGRSAWTLLWLLLPVLGPIVVLFRLLGRGTDGTNAYGRDPRAHLGYFQVDIAR